MAKSYRLVVLYCPSHPFERHEELIRSLEIKARRFGYPGPFRVVRTHIRFQKIPRNAFILTDDPSRLGSTVQEILRWLTEAIARGTEVLIPEFFNLRVKARGFKSASAALLALSATRKAIRSRAIRQGQWTAWALHSKVKGRMPIPVSIREMVQREFEETGDVRKTVETFRVKGIAVSRSTIYRVIKSKRRKAA